MRAGGFPAVSGVVYKTDEVRSRRGTDQGPSARPNGVRTCRPSSAARIAATQLDALPSDLPTLAAHVTPSVSGSRNHTVTLEFLLVRLRLSILTPDRTVTSGQTIRVGRLV